MKLRFEQYKIKDSVLTLLYNLIIKVIQMRTRVNKHSIPICFFTGNCIKILQKLVRAYYKEDEESCLDY